MISSNSEGNSKNRKLGVISREQKETIRCKDDKKNSHSSTFCSFYLLSIIKRYLIHNLIQTFNYIGKTNIYFYNV